MVGSKQHTYERGFTLIELMATLVILSLITLIAIPSIGNVIASAEASSDDVSIEMVESAAQIADTAGLEHDMLVRYNVDTLVDNGYLDIDPDHILLEGSPFVEKYNHTYRYFGPTNVSETEGRNLVKDSNRLNGWHASDGATATKTFDSETGYTHITTTDGIHDLKALLRIYELDQYEGVPIKISFDFINHKDIPVVLYGNSFGFQRFDIEPGFNGRIRVDARVGGNQEQLQFRSKDVSHDLEFSIKHIKIEISDTFTDWTPAPEDVA